MIVVIISLLQLSFGIMCVTLFSYFKNSYLIDDDGVNVEFKVQTYSDYDYAFYFWITGVVLSLLLLLIGILIHEVNKEHDEANPFHYAKLSS